jgi:hypothetical protein
MTLFLSSMIFDISFEGLYDFKGRDRVLASRVRMIFLALKLIIIMFIHRFINVKDYFRPLLCIFTAEISST